MPKLTKRPNRTDWHRLLCIMTAPLFEQLGCEVTIEMDLSIKVQRLDMAVVTRTRPLCFDKLKAEYYEGFENMAEHNLISFKSFREVFNMTSMEEFYGHLINYRKIKQLKRRDQVNLYAVTHYHPKGLFKRWQGTPFLKCIVPNRMYDLNLLTPVRFIITKDSDHPILGLFSNNTEQIQKSRDKLAEDAWLHQHVSSYLNKLYDFYQLEGVKMPYTREVFVKEYYPEHYGTFLLGKQEGIQEGELKGELIGKIQLLQQILKKPVASRDQLRSKNMSTLQKLADALNSEWMRVD